MKAKRLFFRNVVALFLCVAMLLGSTYAWFTDLAESKNNVIQTGKLDVEMYWSDTLLAADSSEWKNGENVPLFTSTTWEPGRTEVKYIKVKNAGNLSFKWKLAIEAVGKMTKLADVIDVYCVNPVDAGLTSASLTVGNHTGVLTDVVDMEQVANGVLLPAGETSTEHLVGDTILAIAFHMQESAGNEYIGLSLGDGFKVNVYATQFAYESGSFGDSYDKDAQWPNHNVPVGNAVSAPVNTTADDKVAENVALTDSESKISASIPAGVQLEPDVDTVTLTVSEVENSKANISLNETEATLSIDVHVSGVAKTNSVIMPISIKELLPVGLNMGNYRFYHVEDGNTVEMALLGDGQTPVHNNYEYDPATGDVVLYLASFSEVALVADTENAWEGKFDYTWYDADATELTIANADQLAAFGAIVGGMNGQTQDSFKGKTVKLIADINLGDKESENNPELIFHPIGYYYNGDSSAPYSTVYSFEGTFDGNGNTIANFYQNTWEIKGDYDGNYYKDAMGLFGYVVNGTVKNLTVDNFSSDGEFTPTGVIAAYVDGNSTFENIAITNCNPRVYNTGNGGIIGIAGDTSAANDDHITLKNITVDNSNKISALWGSWDVACGGLVGMYRGNVDGNGNATGDTISFENCHVSAQIDVYNDVCANYQYYAYRYAGMIIGSVRHNTTNADGKTVPNMEGISASDCTVHFGTWNDYYYCEFEKNSMASYSPDYQFSRVPHSELNFTDTNDNGIIDTDEEKLSVNGCKHTHTAEENNQAIYLPFYNLFTGYGWGVSSMAIDNWNGITKLDVEEGDHDASVKKFESNISNLANGINIKLGDIFKFVDNGIKLVPSALTVTVTNTVESNPVSSTIDYDRTNWENTTIKFKGVGIVKITIQDYYFCTPTTITVEISNHEHEYDNACDLECNLCLEKREVGAHIYDNDCDTTCNECGFERTIEHTWKNATCIAPKTCSVCDVTEGEALGHITKKFTGDFLYRVGNQNAVNLSSLFNVGNRTEVNVSFTTVSGDASAEGTSSIQFKGTGVIKVIVSNDCICDECIIELNLEVVNATNVAKNGKIGNYNTTSVLLGNTTISTLYLNGGATLYGNGFTIDCTNSPINGSGSVSENYIIEIVDAHLDNIRVVGKVYPEYGAMASSDYNRALVVSKGNSTITNCYLSNTSAPIRLVEGSLYVKGTTVKGGNFANIDVRNGHLTVEDVTTINQALSNDKAGETTVVGLGIVVYYENVDTTLTSITVKGTLTQYNHISSTDTFSHEYATQLVDEMMSKTYTDLQFTANNVTWVNPGIIEMTRLEKRTGYNGEEIDFYAQDGYVYAVKPDANSIALNPADYATLGQGAIAPTYSFDYTSKNYQQKVEGSNDYCYYDSGKVLISMDQGDTFNWDPFILTATKYGQILDYTVTMNGTTYTSGQKIAFNASGDYVVTYTYIDGCNYTVDENGNLKAVEVTYTKTVTISVSVIKPKTQHATFTFADTNTATQKVTVGDKTYISASGVSETDKEWGYITVNGTKIFYPITEAQMKKNTLGTEVQVYYYVFKDAVTITDYKDGGTGGPQTYDSGTTTKPSNLAVVNGMEAKYTSISSACVDISKLTKDGPSGEVWDFSASTTVSGTTTYNNYLAHQSPSGLAVKSGTRDYDAITVAQFAYTDAAGATYYYFVGYFMPNQYSGSSGGSCVTPDTLITLADGTQVRVDSLTGNEELLVWNMETGKLDKAPIMFVDSEAEAEFEVIKLKFSDGTEVKVIGEHGFWDYDLNKYVYLDANAADYIGHTFAKQNGDSLEKVQLVDVVIETEVNTAWSPVTVGHLCYFVNGMLSMPGGVGGLFNIFEVDAETMTYDYEQIEKDIETYGLFTYEELNAICPLSEDMFNAAGGAYLKISIGKGNLTMEELINMINRYSKYI